MEIDLIMLQVALATVSFVLAGVLVGVVRRFAVNRGMLDIPGVRTSHRAPTPRGGGLGVLGAIGVAAAILALRGIITPTRSWLSLLAVLTVAVVGWLDDWRSVPVRDRLLVHAAAGILLMIVATPHLRVASIASFLNAAWWVFWAVSTINVTNFMDGIDGLVGATIAVYSGYVFVAAPRGSATSLLALTVSAALAGFLVWNWPPARVFLGDVGSGALGLITAFEGVALMHGARLSFAAAFLPLVPLYVDAAATLIVRWRRGEKLTSAHRAHLYQRLSNGGWGHGRVTTLYVAMAALGALVAIIFDHNWPAIAAYAILVCLVGFLLDRSTRRLPATASPTP